VFDAGAAFFVESVDEEEHAGIPPELATSPLPNSYFPPRWETEQKDEKSSRSVNRSLIESFNEETNGNDSSASNSPSEFEATSSNAGKRNLTGSSQLELGEEAMEEGTPNLFDTSIPTKEGETNVAIQTDLSNTGRGKLNRKKRKRRSMNMKHTRSSSKTSIKDMAIEADFDGINDANKCEVQGSDDIFDMDDVHDEEVALANTPTHSPQHEILDNKKVATSDVSDGVTCTSNSYPSTPIATIPSTVVKDSVNTSNLPSHSSLPKFPQINPQIERDISLSKIGSSTSFMEDLELLRVCLLFIDLRFLFL
jgi:hypothetical protein